MFFVPSRDAALRKYARRLLARLQSAAGQWEAGLTGEPPAYRITCIFVDRDYRLKGVAAVAVRGALHLIAKAGGGVVQGYPHDLQGEKMRSQFLYSATRSLFEDVGFTSERPKGKKNCVMRTTVLPVAAS